MEFIDALEVTLHHEGGLSNHKDDTGGLTNFGITQTIYNKCGYTGTVRNIKPEEVEHIYRKYYWDLCRCEDLPNGLDLMTFDWAVNSGPKTAMIELQKQILVPENMTPEVGLLKADGIIGSKTLERINSRFSRFECDAHRNKFLDEYRKSRIRWIHALENYDTFGRGWLRRIADVYARAIK